MGRPRGSKNKRSVGIPPELSKTLGHEDPAKVLGEIYSMPIEKLKKLVRSKAGATAVAMKIRAAEVAMPYQYSKMPTKLVVQDDKLPTLIIYKGQHQMQQNQALMKDVTPVVGCDASSDVMKAEEKQDDSTS